jgi:hypothetical protein
LALAFGQLLSHEGNTVELEPAQSLERYFNLAHCACSQQFAAGPGYLETTYAYELLAQGTAPARPVEIWVGTQCDDPAMRAAHCHRITAATIPDASMIPAAGATPEVPIIDLMQPEGANLGCDMRAITGEEWALLDTDGDGTYDVSAGISIPTDALAPPLPTDFSVDVGGQSLDLLWTPPADTSDIYAYQALCATATGDPGRPLPPPLPEYITPRQLCGLSLDVPLVPSAILPGDNTDVQIPQSIAELDPAIICGESHDPDASSLHLDHLRANRPYVVLLAVVDRAGNASATYFHPTLTTNPSPSGGCCRASGDEPPLALALFVLAFFRRGTGTRSCRRSGSRGTMPSAPPPPRTRRAPDPATTTR